MATTTPLTVIFERVFSPAMRVSEALPAASTVPPPLIVPSSTSTVNVCGPEVDVQLIVHIGCGVLVFVHADRTPVTLPSIHKVAYFEDTET
jgi:hypothetical protein